MFLVVSMNDLGVVTHNIGAVVDLLADMLTVLSHNVLALLNVGRVHDGLAHRPGDLLGLVLRHTLTLLLHILSALGTTGVPLVSRLSLVISTDNMTVMAHHMTALGHPCVGLLAVPGHNLLALFSVGGVNHNIILLMALLSLLLNGLLVTLLLNILFTLRL